MVNNSLPEKVRVKPGLGDYCIYIFDYVTPLL